MVSRPHDDGMPPEPEGISSADRFMQSTEEFRTLAATLGGFRKILIEQGFDGEVADRLVLSTMEQAFLETRREWAIEAAGRNPHRLENLLGRWFE